MIGAQRTQMRALSAQRSRDHTPSPTHGVSPFSGSTKENCSPQHHPHSGPHSRNVSIGSPLPVFSVVGPSTTSNRTRSISAATSRYRQVAASVMATLNILGYAPEKSESDASSPWPIDEKYF